MMFGLVQRSPKQILAELLEKTANGLNLVLLQQIPVTKGASIASIVSLDKEKLVRVMILLSRHYLCLIYCLPFFPHSTSLFVHARVLAKHIFSKSHLKMAKKT